MSHRAVWVDRLEVLHDETKQLLAAILDGPGASSPDTRRRVFEGIADDPVIVRYVDTVRRHAHRVTDEDVDALRAAGLDDDAIFELTVAAAVGAADERLRAGLSLLGRRS